MRHRKAGKKLGRTVSHRNAMFRNMVTSLFEHGRIRTTDAKAKELRRWADHIITLAKRGDLHARRQALAVIRDKTVVHKLFEQAQERFGDRAGGYTNVIKIGRRRGDAAPISLIQFVSPIEKKEKKKTKPAKKKGSVKTKEEAPKKAKTPEKKEPVKAKEKKQPRKTKGSGPAAKKVARKPKAEKAAASQPVGKKGRAEARAKSEAAEAPEGKKKD